MCIVVHVHQVIFSLILWQLQNTSNAYSDKHIHSFCCVKFDSNFLAFLTFCLPVSLVVILFVILKGFTLFLYS